MSPEPDEFAAGFAEYGTLPGWLCASGILLVATGIAHATLGAASLSGGAAISATGPPWGSLQAWGMAWLLLGAGELLAAALIRRGHRLGRPAGVALAIAVMVVWFVNFTFLPLIAFALALMCGFVLYGLLVC